MGARRLEQLADPAAEGGARRPTGCGSTSATLASWSGCLTQMLDVVTGKPHKVNWTASAKAAFARSRRSADPDPVGFRVVNGRLLLDAATQAAGDPAQDPDVVLQLFVAMARSGCSLERGSEERISQGLPLLSAHLEEGPSVASCAGDPAWSHAGETLRAMHALGILELLIPEFHGIDALVIRDAYHRYTVDEHTMVLIDTLHGLKLPQTGPMGVWADRFGGILRDVQHQALLYLAALLHDTGKGRSTADHAWRARGWRRAWPGGWCWMFTRPN